MNYGQPKWRWINSVRWLMIGFVLFFLLSSQKVPPRILGAYVAAEALWFLQKRVGPKVRTGLKRRRLIREVEADYQLLSQHGLAVFSESFRGREEPRQTGKALGVPRCVTSTIGWFVEVALDVVRFVVGGLLFFAGEALLSGYRRLTGQKKKKRRQTQPDFKEGAD